MRPTKVRQALRHTHLGRGRLLGICVLILILSVALVLIVLRPRLGAQVQWIRQHWLNAAAIAAFAAVGSLALQLVYRDRGSQSDSKLIAARRTLLNQVTWRVEEMQAGSIPETVHIDLEIHSRPDLRNSTGSDQIVAVPRRLVPTGPMGEYFNRVGNRLVILGAPGSGKTSVLTGIARDLIAAARADEREPVPIVLNLGSWASRNGTLDNWLIDVICYGGFYGVSQDVAQWLIKNDQLILLLDGLDEVASDYQSGCFSAIANFRERHGLLRIILCCRTQEFVRQINSGLEPIEIIEIQRPTESRVVEALAELERRGIFLASIRSALEIDDDLREFLRSPLVLNVVALAYMGDSPYSIASLRLPGTPEERLARLWRKYVEKMFEHRPLRRFAYSSEEASGWLAWLAHALTIRNTDAFQLDRFNSWPRIQRDTRQLGSESWRIPRYYRRPFWYAISLFLYLPEGLLSTLSLLTFPAGGPWRAGVLFGIAYLVAAPHGGIVNELITCILGAVAFTALVSRVDFGSTSDQGWPAVERVYWSRSHFSANLGRAIEAGLANGVIGGLIAGLKVGIMNGLWHGAFFGVIASVAFSLLVGLRGGSDGSLAMESVRPDIGIWRSLHHAVWFGGIAGMVGLLAGGLLGRTAADGSGSVALGLGSAIGLGLAVAFRFGAGTWYLYGFNVDHLALARCGPWKYGEFLQAMAERTLLRRTGRSYAFVHIELRDHFARQHLGGGFVESGMIDERGRLWKIGPQIRTNVWSRFQPDARNIVTSAEQEARQRNSDHVAPGDILLALISNYSSEEWSDFFTNQQANYIRERLDVLLKPGAEHVWGDIQFSLSSKKVFRDARSEASRSGAKGIGAIHILIALASSRDEIVSEALTEANLDMQRIREGHK